MPIVPWEQKEERVKEAHPEALDVSWSEVMQSDPDLFARIISDVVKASGSVTRPGKRPSLNGKEAEATYSRLAGEDFSSYPFAQAFRILAGKRSVRSVANKVDLAPSFVYNLLNERAEPSYETIEKIAKGFKKHPSYFIEYRVGFVQSAIGHFLESSPETATAWYIQIRGK